LFRLFATRKLYTAFVGNVCLGYFAVGPDIGYWSMLDYLTIFKIGCIFKPGEEFCIVVVQGDLFVGVFSPARLLIDCVEPVLVHLVDKIPLESVFFLDLICAK